MKRSAWSLSCCSIWNAVNFVILNLEALIACIHGRELISCRNRQIIWLTRIRLAFIICICFVSYVNDIRRNPEYGAILSLALDCLRMITLCYWVSLLVIYWEQEGTCVRHMIIYLSLCHLSSVRIRSLSRLWWWFNWPPRLACEASKDHPLICFNYRNRFSFAVAMSVKISSKPAISASSEN